MMLPIKIYRGSEPGRVLVSNPNRGMVEFIPTIWLKRSDGKQMGITEEARDKHCERNVMRTKLRSLATRQLGLSHSIHGHMNKHYLKNKWRRIKNDYVLRNIRSRTADLCR